jgi:hypothetical protein
LASDYKESWGARPDYSEDIGDRLPAVGFDPNDISLV